MNNFLKAFCLCICTITFFMHGAGEPAHKQETSYGLLKKMSDTVNGAYENIRDEIIAASDANKPITINSERISKAVQQLTQENNPMHLEYLIRDCKKYALPFNKRKVVTALQIFEKKNEEEVQKLAQEMQDEPLFYPRPSVLTQSVKSNLLTAHQKHINSICRYANSLSEIKKLIGENSNEMCSEKSVLLRAAQYYKNQHTKRLLTDILNTPDA